MRAHVLRSPRTTSLNAGSAVFFPSRCSRRLYSDGTTGVRRPLISVGNGSVLVSTVVSVSMAARGVRLARAASAAVAGEEPGDPG
jgi:hypothetical protein